MMFIISQMQEEQIKQSLNAFWEESQYGKVTNKSRNQRNGNSFSELSDWSERHRYFNESIVLPKILEDSKSPPLIQRVTQSQSTDYIPPVKPDRSQAKPININFGLPHGLKGFQKSFYVKYLNEKTQRSGSLKMKSTERLPSLDKAIQTVHKAKQEDFIKGIVNRVMNRRNRIKRQRVMEESSRNNRQQPIEGLYIRK